MTEHVPRVRLDNGLIHGSVCTTGRLVCEVVIAAGADVEAAALCLGALCDASLQPATTRLNAASAHVRPTLTHGGRDRPAGQSISPAEARFTTSDTPQRPKLFGEVRKDRPPLIHLRRGIQVAARGARSMEGEALQGR